MVGAGGMGEVYRARDTSLRRNVALKTLPESFANDSERLARFQREAELLASLNHPNIAAIYGLAEGDGVRALVMELVEGEDLADRIAHGPIRLDEVLPIAKQIAEALEAAHEQGIIHRDLKPANVKVRADGTVKVLDFGLAKVLEPLSRADATSSPTITSPAMTRMGVILGTAAYMSPEQARARAVDKRSDVWAFGCVLYEMLTGRAAFGRETVSDTIAAILEGEPDWAALPAGTLPGIQRTLRRCLEKDAKSRLRDIGDAHIELRELSSLEGPAPFSRGARRHRDAPWAVAMSLAVIAGILGWYVATRNQARTVSAGPARFAIELPAAAPLFDRGRGSRFLALSPDGSYLAFFAQQLGQERAQLWLRPLGQLESRLIAVTKDRGFDPFFSPDGRWVGFFEGRQLKKVSIAGGAALTICDLPPGDPLGASWGSDDTIFFTPSRDAGLWRVSAAGGMPQLVLNDKDIEYRLPQVLPNAKAVLFTSSETTSAGRANPQIHVQLLETRERRAVIQGAGAYFVNDYLVFGRGSSLLAVPFNLDRLNAVGTPFPLLDRVHADVTPQVTVSNVGSLAYIPTLGRPDGTLAWVGRDGVERRVPAPARPYVQPRLAPDGKRLAVLIEPLLGAESSTIWTYEFARDALASLTPGRNSAFPVWTPDGNRLTFSSSGIHWKASDGSGSEDRLFDVGLPLSWSPDGRTLTFVRIAAATQQDIWMLPMDSEGGPQKPYSFVQTPYAEGGQTFSPDGRFVAYVSSETGRNEVYVRTLSETGGRWQVSTDGGNEVVWPRKGRELFYRNGNAILAVDVTTTPTFAARKPRRLFEDQYAASTALWPNYDVTADGRRFLMIKPASPAQARPEVINVILNWPEELRRQIGQEKQR